MAKVVKVIELMSESPKSWEDAAQNAIREASRTLRNISSLYVKEMNAEVENGKIKKLTDYYDVPSFFPKPDTTKKKTD